MDQLKQEVEDAERAKKSLETAMDDLIFSNDNVGKNMDELEKSKRTLAEELQAARLEIGVFVVRGGFCREGVGGLDFCLASFLLVKFFLLFSFSP